ncbi:uncharacterized protein BDR25DRAFT_348069 [Lindgomyces ingoldianus]|uniref:Uncharacterized protein n=1 Tax=Lindgomyces ingoldianus TaxID=673940 RepID=A0ACB6RF68_9PLEO|nr:uncharacterized protein BDR25DRAFT_348069 [Lindgomyces ingoldianus]KAF2477752.1 hypothetical protein BDR25DRAFT_348069 [Lindgomyces ingoldianus]
MQNFAAPEAIIISLNQNRSLLHSEPSPRKLYCHYRTEESTLYPHSNTYSKRPPVLSPSIIDKLGTYLSTESLSLTDLRKESAKRGNLSMFRKRGSNETTLFSHHLQTLRRQALSYYFPIHLPLKSAANPIEYSFYQIDMISFALHNHPPSTIST